MCLEALEKLVFAGATVLDVGCGSGILSAGARLLGVDKVFACDIQKDVIESLSLVRPETFFIGSVDAVANGCADIVLANITAKIADRLALDLKRAVKAGGWIVVSGFLEGASPGSFKPSRSVQQGDWLCWICRREDVEPMTEASPDGLTHEAEWWI
jgi:ribosomal protein L11 methyltransferase